MSYTPTIYIDRKSLEEAQMYIEKELEHQTTVLSDLNRNDEEVVNLSLMISIINGSEGHLVLASKWHFYVVDIELSKRNKDFRDWLTTYDIYYAV